MRKRCSWYNRSNMIKHTLYDRAFETPSGEIRTFNLTFYFVSHYTPAKIRERPEDSSPAEYYTDWDPSSLVITEIEEATGKEVNVTKSIDRNMLEEIYRQIDAWLSSDEAYSVYSDAI